MRVLKETPNINNDPRTLLHRPGICMKVKERLPCSAIQAGFIAARVMLLAVRLLSRLSHAWRVPHLFRHRLQSSSLHTRLHFATGFETCRLVGISDLEIMLKIKPMLIYILLFNHGSPRFLLPRMFLIVVSANRFVEFTSPS